MVRTLIGSIVAAALAGGGFVAGQKAAGEPGPARGPADAAAPCAADTCDATVECTDGGCRIRCTAPDGRTCEIELACSDGECKVVRCDGCEGCGDCGAKQGSVAAPRCEPAACEPACSTAPPPSATR